MGVIIEAKGGYIFWESSWTTYSSFNEQLAGLLFDELDLIPKISDEELKLTKRCQQTEEAIKVYPLLESLLGEHLADLNKRIDKLHANIRYIDELVDGASNDVDLDKDIAQGIKLYFNNEGEKWTPKDCGLIHTALSKIEEIPYESRLTECLKDLVKGFKYCHDKGLTARKH